jgi:hypothetical protein
MKKTYPTAGHTAYSFDAVRLNERGEFVNDILLPA